MGKKCPKIVYEISNILEKNKGFFTKNGPDSAKIEPVFHKNITAAASKKPPVF